MSTYHLDYETASESDLAAVGAFAYAEHPSTRILLFAIAKEGTAPLLWDCTQDETDNAPARAMLHEAIASGSLVYAHNALFEAAVSRYRLLADVGLQPPHVDQWRCTQAMCRRAAAPESLASAAEFFGLGDRKNPIGRKLIGVFSIMTQEVLLRTGGKTHKSGCPILDQEVDRRWTFTLDGRQVSVGEAWRMFGDYCLQDVRTEMALHGKLKRFELTGDELASFQFDFRMNHRGVPVNRDALGNAQRLVERYSERLAERFAALTGFQPGQTARVLEWLRERGYPADDLQAGTVDAVLADPPAGMTPGAVDALTTRSLLSFAALKKIPAMLAAANADGRVRGTTQWHAARTGRAGGRIIQPQNFKKSTIEHSELCYRMIREGCPLEDFEELWESPLEAIASSVRHFIQPPDGRMVLDADFVGVEARITPWLAGDKRKLQLILDGVDLYKRMASIIFGIPYEQITKGQRTIAKPTELGCCYGVGGKGLRDALAKPPYCVSRTRKECDGYVEKYRDSHPETVQAWKDIEEAAKRAIRQSATPFFACGNKLQLMCGRVAGIDYLTMRLPSGRRLYYPRPVIRRVFKEYDEEDMAEDPWKREERGYWIDQIMFHGRIGTTTKWGNCATWGSRLFENAVQAIGADLLNHGMVCAEKAGYDIFMPVHDQALAEDNGLPLEGFISALCTKQPWAADFPLEASGAVHPYYLKD